MSNWAGWVDRAGSAMDPKKTGVPQWERTAEKRGLVREVFSRCKPSFVGSTAILKGKRMMYSKTKFSLQFTNS